ncbi:uncharacterized protein LOC133339597 isoform X2 [Lethenteron reissneri]|nr:uncharacterized protein LOC133339588 isoform X2 [Lethenteron reissneri]XP_061403705.1 uncharacterized protein LOC133339597 isoform X2 [Lethenteron reissneri]XP_061403706.1 uncharacterized protein LOC133339597 isoform X2 [Lethenteron reissneri]
MKWVLVAAFISLLPVTSAVKLQLSLPESVDVTEGENVTLPCSFSSLSTDSSGLYITWLTMPTRYIIYDSLHGNIRLGIAEFAGDKEKGDCSLRLLNVSRTLSPVFKCHVICTSCGKDDLWEEGEVKLNVKPAAPRSHGEGVSDSTLSPLEETSHKGGVVAAWVLPVAIFIISVISVISVIIIVVFVWKKIKRRRSSGPCRR